MDKEYLIFCDESLKIGKFYSNFYGGLIIGASQYQKITEKLNKAKNELNLFMELKWKKVSERYLDKYLKFIEYFFKEIEKSNIKIRIMFQQNAYKPNKLTKEQKDNQYFLLYYQFIKHAFGLNEINANDKGTKIRLYFDRFPHNKERVEQFKGYIHALQYSAKLRAVNITIAKEDIAEVDSKKHVLLQGLDIVLGAMAFRLNDKHKEKLPGKNRRGNKTVAKEKIYKQINQKIREIYPNFNIGITTGSKKGRWDLQYSHWKFTAKDSEYKESKTKKWKTKNPTGTT